MNKTYEKITELLLSEVKRSFQSTQQKKTARERKRAATAQKLIKKGGHVGGVHVSPEAMKHLTTRGQGSQSTEAPGVGVVRQLKLAGKKHRKDQVSVTAPHRKPVGHELVRPKSEIPSSDVTKTTTTTKPERGEDISVPKVHTDKPLSHYATTKGTSIAVKKDPKFMAPRGRKERKRAYKKRTTGHTLITQFPGRSAPPASQWGKSGHVVIKPKGTP